jgi:hypothetical protein
MMSLRSTEMKAFLWVPLRSQCGRQIPLMRSCARSRSPGRQQCLLVLRRWQIFHRLLHPKARHRLHLHIRLYITDIARFRSGRDGTLEPRGIPTWRVSTVLGNIHAPRDGHGM